MVKLTPKLITTEVPNENLDSLQKLALPGKDIEKIVRLSACTQLVRLDLSNNRLTSLEGVSQNLTLKWLAAAGNQISNLHGLEGLNELQVLNLGHNKLQGHLEVNGMSKLRALMLNDNLLTEIHGLGNMPELNTLILKQNQISDLGTNLYGCTALAKLQIGHNRLKQLGTALCGASSLAELRLSHNQLTELPQELARNARLKLIEVGSNPISDYSNIEVVAHLPSLHQLNLRGCPIAEGSTYPDTVLKHLPGLDVLDSKKLIKTGVRFNSKPVTIATAPASASDGAKVTGADVAHVQSSKGLDQSSSIRQKTARGDMQGTGDDTKGSKAAKRSAQTAVLTDTDVADAASGPIKKKVRRVADASASAVLADAADQIPKETVLSSKMQKQLKKKGQRAHQDSVEGSAQTADGRSFLADVLHPQDDSLPKKKQESRAKPDPASTGGMADSGLLKIIDTLPSKVPKSKESKQRKSSNPVPSGVAAVKLLQTGTGLETLQVGMGASSSWD